MELPKRFKGPWGVRIWITTSLSLVMFVGFPIPVLVISVLEGNPGLFYAGLAFLVLLAIPVLLAWQGFIRGYLVSPNFVTVERVGRDLRFALAELDSAQVDPRAMKGTYAMLNGGLFSLGGKGCRNRRLGSYECYATDPRCSVVLRFPHRVLVLTPHDPQAFVKAIDAARQ